MEKKVLITVNSLMDSADGSSDKISFVTEGKLIKENSEYVLSYEESKITGLEGTTTTMRIGKDSVTLIRHGSIDTLMLFEVGKTHLSSYDTPYGNIMIGVTAKHLHIDINDCGGNIAVEYILEYNRSFGGRNKLNVTISEQKKSEGERMEQ
ncbi:MAG: DUF1934 domain-containing protein [Clostridiaceae bacterium]|nr:DUF1934 domain-containing protein [Clostridiaceae bacterium]